MSEWTKGLPTKPGAYGDYVGLTEGTHRPRFYICHVYPISNGVMHEAGGQFLFEGSYYGVFKPLDEAAPDLTQFGIRVQATK